MKPNTNRTLSALIASIINSLNAFLYAARTDDNSSRKSSRSMIYRMRLNVLETDECTPINDNCRQIARNRRLFLSGDWSYKSQKFYQAEKSNEADWDSAPREGKQGEAFPV